LTKLLQEISKLSDYELVLKMKGRVKLDRTVKGTLIIKCIKPMDVRPELRQVMYKRYYPMMCKHRYTLSKFFKQFPEMEYDFEQDAFFAMLKAIEYTNLDKCQENWRFFQVYSWKLKTLASEYRKRIMDLCTYETGKIPSLELEDDMGEDTKLSNWINNSAYDEYELGQNEELKRNLTKFMNKLTPLQKKVITLQLEKELITVKDEQGDDEFKLVKKHNVNSIAKELGKTPSYIYQLIAYAKNTIIPEIFGEKAFVTSYQPYTLTGKVV